MAAALRGPPPGNDHEVGDVIGGQRAAVSLAQGEERLVVLGLPAPFDRGDHVVAAFAQPDSDMRRVVVVER